MKRRKMKMIAAAVLAAGMILGLAACGGSQTQPDDAPDAAETQAPAETQTPETQAPETQAPAETQAAPETEAGDGGDYSAQGALPSFRYDEVFAASDSFDPAEAAAYDYLALEKNSDHDPDHVMIPYVAVVAVDDTDPSDVLIYGDYYLWEFALEGDVLDAVSGGHCPGVIHAERSGEGETAVCSAVGMDEAFTDSDEGRIFGDHYDDYRAAVSDEQARDAAIAQVIADYVRVNGLEVTGFRLGGGEARQLP